VVHQWQMVRMPGPLRRPFPKPPERLRVGPFKEDSFTSSLHHPRVAALLGIALGITFLICFVTGLLSHLIQHPPSWFEWPSRPAGLYRITQGVHVATGLASIPLLLAKLWTVYPRLWRWPPVADGMHLIERVTLLPLVAGSIFMLFTGLANIGLWYPWRFFFPSGHYWGAWITMGALVVHIGAKASIVLKELSSNSLDLVDMTGDGLTRRGFLGVVAATSGIITLTTIGQTFRPLNPFAVLAPRRPDVGPQGFPVNKSAVSAGVTETARDPDYRLFVGGQVDRPLSLSLDDLRALPQHEATLPIACVEGWSANAHWSGLRVRDLLDMAGAEDDVAVLVESMQPSGLYRRSELNPSHSSDEDTLLALEVNGEVLHIDHGFPLRLIGPNRPGVMQTKWVNRLTVR
jgi:DMSO/TMAO reductase YedYZ molybdopterin-dependent catalytic subunit